MPRSSSLPAVLLPLPRRTVLQPSAARSSSQAALWGQGTSAPLHCEGPHQAAGREGSLPAVPSTEPAAFKAWQQAANTL